LESGSPEESIARDALFGRHPGMSSWPSDHGWFFAKLDIESVLVVDFYSAIKEVPLEDYYAATPY